MKSVFDCVYMFMHTFTKISYNCGKYKLSIESKVAKKRLRRNIVFVDIETKQMKVN